MDSQINFNNKHLKRNHNEKIQIRERRKTNFHVK